MKRWIALMAALLMLLSLAACGTPNASEVRGEVGTNETTPTEAPTEAETTAELELGKAENNVYTNQFLGLGCKLDEDWQFTPEEELLQQSQIVADNLTDEQLKEQIQNASVIYDMIATNISTGASVNVNLQNIGLVYGALLDMETYFQQIAEQLPSAMAQLGLENTQIQKTEVTFLGETVEAIQSHSEIQGADFYQLQIPIIKSGYIANITISSFTEDGVTQILNTFYAL